MVSKFASITRFKKIKLDEAEANLQKAYKRLYKAQDELENSKRELEKLTPPSSGDMKSFLAQRGLVDAQFKLIEKNKNWVAYESNQINALKDELKKAYIEYEKFKYLEYEDIKRFLKAKKIKESKELDDIATISFNKQVKK